MKKTLAAVAVLGAFAGSALAADVTLYGVIDTGLNWTQTKVTGQDTKDSFSMASGQNSGPRFGLKGTEDLGNGYKVGFNLENSFKSDTGSLDKGSRLFHREALVYVQSPFGELSMGRTGALDAGTGRYNLMGSGATAMGTGLDAIGKSTKILLGTGDRMDNTITYATPTFAGVTVYAQASLKKDGTQADKAATTTPTVEPAKVYTEGSSDADRYYALGAKFSADGLNAGLVVSMNDYSRNDMKKDYDDGYTVSGFVNYDFGMVQPMFAAQYWDNGKVGTYTAATATDALKIANTTGYGFVIGAKAPVLGGLVKVTGGWNDFEAADSVKPTVSNDFEGNNWMVGVSYEYKLSKRTMVYTGAGYTEEELKFTGNTPKIKTKTSEVLFGLVHTF